MAKLADRDDQSPAAWAGLTAAILAVSLVLPFPYVRIFLAGGVAYAVMLYLKHKHERQP